MNALTVLGVIFFLALEMLLSTDPRLDRLTAVFVVPAPVVAFATAISESLKRATHALHIVRSHRARAMVRGILITIPVIVVFALLLVVSGSGVRFVARCNRGAAQDLGIPAAHNLLHRTARHRSRRIRICRPR